MRAVLDTNVYVSYLLSSRDHRTTVDAVADAALAGAFDLLLPDELLDELSGSVENTRKLSRVTDLDDARELAGNRALLRRAPPLPYALVVPGYP